MAAIEIYYLNYIMKSLFSEYTTQMKDSQLSAFNFHKFQVQFISYVIYPIYNCRSFQ